jgi:FkbM family methyltransferase
MKTDFSRSLSKRLAEQFFWRLSGSSFVQRFGLLNRLHYKWPIRLSRVDELYRVEDDYDHVFIARPRRLVFYWEGVRPRLDSLASQYLLDRIRFEEGDLVIDVGANVGEIGKWFQGRNVPVEYLAVEPSQREFKALQANNPDGTCLNIALWKESADLEFFDRNDTGDSSLFRVSESDDCSVLSARRLDSLERLREAPRVKLLKLEAEGAEPEILLGGSDVLTKVEFISVDCGFERGSGATSTADEVLQILSAYGFICIGCNPSRLILLFHSSAYVGPSDR